MSNAEARKRKWFSFNIIDVAIVLVVVAIIAGVLLKRSDTGAGSLTVSGNDLIIEFDIVVEGVRDITVQAVQEGASFIDRESGMELGTVTSKRTEPRYDTLLTLDGRMVRAEVPDRYTLIISVRGEGRLGEFGHLVKGSRHVAPGGGIQISTGKVETSGYIAAVNSYKK